MRFSTDAACNGCKARIMEAVEREFPDAQWNLDLENVDKVLEVHGIPENAETAARVLKTLKETGFNGSWLQQ